MDFHNPLLYMLGVNIPLSRRTKYRIVLALKKREAAYMYRSARVTKLDQVVLPTAT